MNNYNNDKNKEFNNERFITVSTLNRYLSHKFEIDVHLQDVYIEGEISNFKQSGRHYYFTLKDEISEINAMLFYPATMSLNFTPKDGQIVRCLGRVQIYEKRGSYAIIVRKMIDSGIGLAFKQFLELKEKLQNEGLFDETHKLPLPEYPKRVAIVTSPNGEAIHDIISTFNRRLPLANLIVYPVLVQGQDAPLDMIKALKSIYTLNTEDVIIIGRGGGSYEDLACFNDEKLARVLFASPIPTISAIGHEGDFTICDFVSSKRAPTPTAAAIFLTKDRNEIMNLIDQLDQRLYSLINSLILNNESKYKHLALSYRLTNFKDFIDYKENNLENLKAKLEYNSPKQKILLIEREIKEHDYKLFLSYKTCIENLENTFINLKDNLSNNTFTREISDYEQKVHFLLEKMEVLNPLHIMNKGYSIVKKDNQIITSVKNVLINDKLQLLLQDGEIYTLVTDIKEYKNGE